MAFRDTSANANRALLVDILKEGGKYKEEDLQAIADSMQIPVGVLTAIAQKSVNAGGVDLNGQPISTRQWDEKYGDQRNFLQRIIGGAKGLVGMDEKPTRPDVSYTFGTEAARRLPDEITKIEKTAEPEGRKAARITELGTPSFVAREKEVSEKVKIPEMEATYKKSTESQVEVQKSMLENAKQLDLYKRNLETTNPTPKELADIDHLTHQNSYLDSMAYYYQYMKAEGERQTLMSKVDSERLKAFNAYVDANPQYFNVKGKNGTIKSVEYDPTSKQFKNVIANLQAKGIDFAVVTNQGIIGKISGGKYVGAYGFDSLGDKVSIMPIPPKSVNSPDFMVGYSNYKKGVQAPDGVKRPYLENGKPKFFNGKQVFLNEKGQKVY